MKPIEKMSADEINREIGRWYGIRLVKKKFGKRTGYNLRYKGANVCNANGVYGWGWQGSAAGAWRHCPNFWGDLNKIAQAREKITSLDDQRRFMNALHFYINPGNRIFPLVDAESRLQAMALVKFIRGERMKPGKYIYLKARWNIKQGDELNFGTAAAPDWRPIRFTIGRPAWRGAMIRRRKGES